MPSDAATRDVDVVDRFSVPAGPPTALPEGVVAARVIDGQVEIYWRDADRQVFIGVANAGDVVLDFPTPYVVCLLTAPKTATFDPVAVDETVVDDWREFLRRHPVIAASPPDPNLSIDQFQDECHGILRSTRDAADADVLTRIDAPAGTAKPAGTLQATLRDAAIHLDVPESEIAPVPAAASLADMPQLARTVGVRARKVTLRPDWQLRDQGPLIVESTEGHSLFMVWDGRRYATVDGRPTAVAAPEGVATRAFVVMAPFPASDRPVRDLIPVILRGNAKEFRSILSASLLAAVIGLLTPIAIGWIFSDIAPSGELGLLIGVGIALLFAAIVEAAIGIFEAIAMTRILGRTETRLSAMIYDRLLRLPTSFFRDHTAGDLSQRVGDADEIRGLILSTVLTVGLTTVLSVGYFGLLIYYSPFLALLAALLVSVYIVIVLVARVWQMPYIRASYEVDGKLSDISYETVAAIAKLRTAAAEDRGLSRWMAAYAEEQMLHRRSGEIAGIFAAFSNGWQIITTTVLFAFIGLGALDDFPPGIFIAFLAAFAAFQASFVNLSAALIEIFAAQPQLDRARPLLSSPAENAKGQALAGELTGAIEVKDLTFAYKQGQAPVLTNVSLEIEAGQHVAIVGGSGSGKSTFLRLLLGFERPDSGAILFDGRDLAQLDLSTVRAQMGVVLQSSSLFAGSLIENIRGATEASVEECMEACTKAGFANDIEQFPMGLHTAVTEGAAVLSGGQRQRILIARALVGSPRILFFDEATSALDNLTQAVVSKTLDELSITRITIAHRLSTVEHADKICVLRKGRFVEQGTYTELMALNGYFADLAKRQLAEDGT